MYNSNRNMPISSKSISNRPIQIYGIRKQIEHGKQIWELEYFYRVLGRISIANKHLDAVRYNKKWHPLWEEQRLIKLIKSAQSNENIQILIEGNSPILFGRKLIFSSNNHIIAEETDFHAKSIIKIIPCFDMTEGEFFYETFG